MVDAVVVQDVTKEYDLGKTRVQALRGITLCIEPGDFATLAGPSGSGKSTLLNIIGCLDCPTSGEVFLGGAPVGGLGGRDLDRLRLRTIGFVFQSFNLIPVLNVYENIELPLLIRPDISRRERRERVLYFIEEIGLADQVRQKPAELSGGQRQRVAVARALATGPEIVLADEPTANLDSATGIEIIELMHELNRIEGTTFLFSSHDPKIIERATRVFHLADGRLLEGAVSPGR